MPDPGDAALGRSKTVVNVDAGSGSYEPGDRYVLAVEPSTTMIRQRRAGAPPGLQASAEDLPFADARFDVALAIVTIHHWRDWAAGLREMQRVADRWWFCPSTRSCTAASGWPGITSQNSPSVWRDVPAVDEVAAKVGVHTEVRKLLVPCDCVDGFLPAH